MAIDATFPFSYFIRGLVRHAQGQRDQATADFQKSAGLNFPYAVYWVWITQMEAGQTLQARKDLSDALKPGPRMLQGPTIGPPRSGISCSSGFPATS